MTGTYAAASNAPRGPRESGLDWLALAERALDEGANLDAPTTASLVARAAGRALSVDHASRARRLLERAFAVGLDTQCLANGTQTGRDEAPRLSIMLAAALRVTGDLARAKTTLQTVLQTLAPHQRRLRAEALTELGLVHHALDELSAAARCYARALLAHDVDDVGGRLLTNLGAVAHDRGDLAQAQQRYHQALACGDADHDPRLRGVAGCHLGLIYQERGLLERAARRFTGGLRDLELASAKRLHAVHTGNLAQLRLEQGDIEGARSLGAASLSALRTHADPRSTGRALCRLAAAQSLSGTAVAATSSLAEATEIAEREGDTQLAGLVALNRTFLRLADAEREQGVERQRVLGECCAELELAVAEPGFAWRESDDARTARRVLLGRVSGLDVSDVSLPDDMLGVCVDARFYREPGAGWRDLRARPSASRMLDRLTHPHTVITAGELAAAAWPRERLSDGAARGRVRVELASLRRHGLGSWIVSAEGGYRLSHPTRVLRLPRSAPPADARWAPVH